MVAVLLAMLGREAMAGGWELGLGGRSALDEGGTAGLRLIGRHPSGDWFAVEGDLYLRPPGARNYSDLDLTLLEIGQDSGLPDGSPAVHPSADLATGSALVDLSLFPAARKGLTGGPHALAGLELRYRQSGTATLHDDGTVNATITDHGFEGALVLGTAVDLWAGHLGLRWSALARIWPEADRYGSGSTLSANPTLALDLLFSP